LRHYRKYALRFRGDFADIPYATATDQSDLSERPAYANLTNLVARQMRAELYWRNPRAEVLPLSGYNATTFTPLLARLETHLLTHTWQQTGLYRTMRKALLDGVLGPYMVVKVWFDGDVATDPALIEAARREADDENKLFLAGIQKPVVRPSDVAAVHIDRHEALLAAAKRGEIQMPDSAIRYMEKHIAKHKEQAGWQTPGETLRNQCIHIARVNPLNYFFDPFNEDVAQREWVGESYIARLEDIKGNPDYDKKAVQALSEVTSILRTTPSTGAGNASSASSQEVRTPDPHVRIFEVVDLVSQQVIVYGENGTTPLQVRPYSMSSIQPGGPYIEASFLEDPLNNFGVSIPFIFEAHQQAMSLIHGVNVQTVLRGAPKLGYNAAFIEKDDRASMAEFVVGNLIPIKNLPEGMKPADVIFQIPPVAIPEQSIFMENSERDFIQKLTGLGSAKLGGGDSSKTATASALISESSGTLADDTAAVLDDFMRRVACHCVRLARKGYDQQRVFEICGEEALLPGGWPMDGFADRDIVMDRGVSIIPNSSRRNTSDVQTKLTLDTLAVVAPLTGTVVPPEVTLELVRRLAESNGIHGIDWESAKQAMVEMAVMSAGGDPAAEQQMGAPPDPGISEAEDPSVSGMQQASANVGGGRIATGASAGDPMRFVR